MGIAKFGIAAIERGWVADRITRLAIRRLCRQRLADQIAAPEIGRRLIDEMCVGDIAPVPNIANEQHYEVSSDFFQQVLGPRLKYSSCFFESENATLADAENAALRITCERAELVDGQEILELGCGWGSLSLWMAQHYPQSRITAVSNSESQAAFINAKAASLGIENLFVVTEDMNRFSAEQRFDRVVSVEMFEHMRNYERLLSKIASWLVDDGKLFVHLFCNANHCYPFETEGASNWMGRYFFTGGIMPSADVFDHFQRDLVVERQFKWNGLHYAKTLECWLKNLDLRRVELVEVLQKVYGDEQADRWLNRWRIFLMASAELFGFEDGEQWFVSHYLLKKKGEPVNGSPSHVCY
jgi:cyclopropane-fatty-acyl-phospholipid synthase